MRDIAGAGRPRDLGPTDVAEVAIDLGGVLGAAGGDGQIDQVFADGTSGDDTTEVLASGTSARVVGLPALLTIADLEATDALVINGLAGDDTITTATVPAGMMQLTIDGGAGDHTLIGSDGADALIGGAGDDDVRGDRGDDVAFLGDGDDIFTWAPGEGSDVVEGEAGFDTLDFIGSGANENIDVSANGERVRFFRDVANVTMDLNDVERIEFAALGGADNVVVNDLSGTDATDVAIDLAGAADPNAGDGRQDRVTVNGTAGGDTIGVASSAAGIVVSGLAAEVSVAPVGHAGGHRVPVIPETRVRRATELPFSAADEPGTHHVEKRTANVLLHLARPSVGNDVRGLVRELAALAGVIRVAPSARVPRGFAGYPCACAASASSAYSRQRRRAPRRGPSSAYAEGDPCTSTSCCPPTAPRCRTSRSKTACGSQRRSGRE